MDHSVVDDAPQQFGIRDLLVALAVPTVFAMSFGPLKRSVVRRHSLPAHERDCFRSSGRHRVGRQAATGGKRKETLRRKQRLMRVVTARIVAPRERRLKITWGRLGPERCRVESGVRRASGHAAGFRSVFRRTRGAASLFSIRSARPTCGNAARLLESTPAHATST